MELASLVALRLSPTILRLASAELAKVLSSLGYYILEQFDLDPSQLLPCLLMSVKYSGSRGVRPLEDGDCRERTRRRVRGKDTEETWIRTS
jgi:hypothetical protein